MEVTAVFKMPSVDDIPQMKEAGLEDVFDRSLATFAGRLATFEKYNWPHADDETCTAEKVSTYSTRNSIRMITRTFGSSCRRLNPYGPAGPVWVDTDATKNKISRLKMEF